MARHLYLHNGVAYEGELALYRDAHVAASSAQAHADLPGLCPGFVYELRDGADLSIVDDEVAVCRFLNHHPRGTVRVIPLRH